MSKLPPLPEKTHHPLVQKALARLGAICKGNGISLKQIKVTRADVRDVRFTAGTFFELTITSVDKMLPGKQQSGEMIADPRDIDRIARDMVASAMGNHGLEETLRQQLTARKDKGFMIEGAVLPVSGMDRTLCWHEPCATCNHSGQVRCDQCQGQKYAPCKHCHGQTMMQCPLCRGSGTNQGQRGPQPCVKCNGRRRVPCTSCGSTGKTPCGKCRGQGQLTCPACRGQAYSTRLITLGLKAQTRADYARAQVPEHMTFLIENDGGKMAAAGDITLTAQTMNEEGKIGVHYDAAFPFADMTVQLSKKPLALEAYGQGKFVRLPPILDEMLAPPLDLLTRAARGSGDVAALLKSAGRYRAIALALVTTIRANAAQTTARLLQKYPEGLSRECAAKIGKAADAAVARITQKPRYIGLGIGLLIVAALYAFYYIGPGRSLITPHIGDPRFNIIIDAFLVIIGGTITTLSIQMSAQGALHKALGHLIPPARRRTLMPRTHGAGLWGYAAGLVIYLIMIEATRHLEAVNTPVWYRAALQFIGL